MVRDVFIVVLLEYDICTKGSKELKEFAYGGDKDCGSKVHDFYCSGVAMMKVKVVATTSTGPFTWQNRLMHWNDRAFPGECRLQSS